VAGDFRCRLPLVEREAHRNPFFECDIAHANCTFNHGPNQVDVLDGYIASIFGQRWGRRAVDTMHDERTLFKIIVAAMIDKWGIFRVGPAGICWISIARDCERLLLCKEKLHMLELGMEADTLVGWHCWCTIGGA
jgi:hypothetical protein